MKKYCKYITAIIIIVLVFVITGGLICWSNQYTEHQYKLYEMNDGVYAIYYTTHSRVPAHNYEVIILCCNGSVYTFKGNVNIFFTDGEAYVKIRNYNTVNSDDIYVYVPQGTVVYQPGVNIGK